MAALERGSPAAAVSDSDSSDLECPEKEPEFIIDIGDGPPRPPPPPPPRHEMRRPAAVPQQQLWFLPRPEPQSLPEFQAVDMPKECTNCFIVKIVHFILVIILVGVTLMLAARLPNEYREGDRGFIMVCPILIGVLALSWLMLAKYDKESC